MSTNKRIQELTWRDRRARICRPASRYGHELHRQYSRHLRSASSTEPTDGCRESDVDGYNDSKLALEIDAEDADDADIPPKERDAVRPSMTRVKWLLAWRQSRQGIRLVQQCWRPEGLPLPCDPAVDCRTCDTSMSDQLRKCHKKILIRVFYSASTQDVSHPDYKHVQRSHQKKRRQRWSQTLQTRTQKVSLPVNGQ